MEEYDKVLPEYGFASNKGYGSAAHIEALKEIWTKSDTQKNIYHTFCIKILKIPTSKTERFCLSEGK